MGVSCFGPRQSCFAAACVLPLVPVNAAPFFTPGNLVVSVEGNVDGSGPYADNQAAPVALFQYTPFGTSSAIYSSSLVLPQTSSGANYAFSGEYGSSSEGTLQLSGNGSYLTIAGYGVNASAFNTTPASYGNSGLAALAQSGSLTGQNYTAVPRVVALIGADGVVDTSDRAVRCVQRQQSAQRLYHERQLVLRFGARNEPGSDRWGLCRVQGRDDGDAGRSETSPMARHRRRTTRDLPGV